MSRVMRPVAVLAIIAILFTLLGFRIAHPKSGLSSAAGGAEQQRKAAQGRQRADAGHGRTRGGLPTP